MAPERALIFQGDSMTHPDSANEKRVAFRIYAALLIVVVVAALIVIAFGLPALGLIGIVATIAVFVILLTITAGN